MPEPSLQLARVDAPPRRVLLATDLSSRCDRAAERAAQLAVQWGASLQVLHVIDSAGYTADPADQATIAKVEQEIRAALPDPPPRAEILVERGDPATLILRQASEPGCGLVVTGPMGQATLSRALLGTTTDALVRRTPVPLLVVRSRPGRPYEDILAATDFSEPSRHALEAALRLIPEARVTVLHAYRVPFEGFIHRDANEDEFRMAAEAELKAFLAQVEAPPEVLDRISVRLAYGQAQDLVCSHVHGTKVDLVVLGTQGRTGLAGFMVGSTAERLLAALPCDVLMVRRPSAPSTA